MPDKIKKVHECIEPDELKQAIKESRKIKIIDVRSKEEYEKFHIPNAVNITLSELKDKLINFDKEYQYVTVNEKGGGRSSDGARLLNEFGYAAIWLCGGTNKWLKVNLT